VPGSRLSFLLGIPVPWVFVLSYLAGVGLQLAFPIRVHSARLLSLTHMAGALLMAAGAALAAWCLILFHRARTTTRPGEISVQLVQSGPYRLSRNPMYVALTLFYLGEMGLLGQVWPAVPLLLTLAYLNSTVIPLEEARLREAFGADYASYALRVRRWL